MLLATAVSSHEVRDDVDFLPLTVDYREKYAAAGRFPGGFFKREARPSDRKYSSCVSLIALAPNVPFRLPCRDTGHDSIDVL